MDGAAAKVDSRDRSQRFNSRSDRLIPESNLISGFRNASRTVPVGPLRCLPICHEMKASVRNFHEIRTRLQPESRGLDMNLRTGSLRHRRGKARASEVAFV